MFKKPTKKLFLIRHILLLTLATLSVVIIAIGSILYIQGYRINLNNGELTQGALLQFDSRPSGADVWIDGRPLGVSTSSKHIVQAGVHTISMKKDGYKDWSRTLKLEAGTLTWLDYVRMVPKSLSPENILPFTKLAYLSFSPDQKWAIAQEDIQKPNFKLIDLRSDKVSASDLIIPSNLYTSSVESTNFNVESWSDNGRYLLVKHIVSPVSTEWLVLDSQDSSKTVNVTKLLSVQFKDIKFDGGSGALLYGLANDGVLRKLDLSAGTMSRSLVTNVTSFRVNSKLNLVSYSGINPDDGSKNVVGIYKDGDNSPTIIRTSNQAGANMLIDVSHYIDNNYLAVSEGGIVTIFSGDLPSDGALASGDLKSYASLKFDSPVISLNFSGRGDHLVAQSSDGFQDYEIEYKRGSAGTSHNLKWLDDTHLWSIEKGQLLMRDFDGSNVQKIMPISNGYDATLSSDGKYFYTVGADGSGYQLQRVKMLI